MSRLSKLYNEKGIFNDFQAVKKEDGWHVVGRNTDIKVRDEKEAEDKADELQLEKETKEYLAFENKNEYADKSFVQEKTEVINKIKKFDNVEIVNAIKALGEEDIAGMNGMRVDEVDDILKMCNLYELKDILGVLEDKLKESIRNNKRGENTMVNAKSFLERLNKLPERYQDLLEGIEQTTTAALIPQDLAIVLVKMTSNSLQGSQTPVYVSKGNGKKYAVETTHGSTEQRTANDWTVCNYGGEVETSQPIVAVYNNKTGENWVASTSKENLKKFLGGASESKKKDDKKKKKMKEAFFKTNSDVNFETLGNLKKELDGFSLKDGKDYMANLYGSALELYIAYSDNSLPEQINDLVSRYGFENAEKPSMEFEKEIEVKKPEGEEEVVEEPKVEEKKGAKKQAILKKPKLASAGKKTKKK